MFLTIPVPLGRSKHKTTVYLIMSETDVFRSFLILNSISLCSCNKYITPRVVLVDLFLSVPISNGIPLSLLKYYTTVSSNPRNLNAQEAYCIIDINKTGRFNYMHLFASLVS